MCLTFLDICGMPTMLARLCECPVSTAVGTLSYVKGPMPHHTRSESAHIPHDYNSLSCKELHTVARESPLISPFMPSNRRLPSEIAGHQAQHDVVQEVIFESCHGFPRLMNSVSSTISVGFTPAIREACPMFKGRTRESFSRDSFLRLVIF